MTVSTRLDYLRHGTPMGGSKYRGHQVDDPLSEEGWHQMRTTTAPLSGWTRVVSSPLLRCRAFAEWIATERGLDVTIEQDLREVGFGAWEGLTRAEVIAQRGDEYEAFYSDPLNQRPLGAEPLDTFGARVAAVFAELSARHPGEHLLIVAHAGVIRATLGHVLQAPPQQWYRAAVQNAALSRFMVDAQGASLQLHNWRPELEN